MAQTNINIRIDAELKKQFEAFCSEIGMSMSTAFTVFAKQAVRQYRIPFELVAERPNEETLDAIREVWEMKADASIGKTYCNVDEMMEELLADV